MKSSVLPLACALLLPVLAAREYHVSPAGDDAHEGTAGRPLRTISAAAQRAQPGDTVTVHAGTYRERVTPPRGGTSDTARITYRAAPGETAVIKGSEVIRDWKPFVGTVWKASVPNARFGKYNPYKDLINGDWFNDQGRPHHTGEVYLNGKSLYETHLLERVLEPRPHRASRDPEGSRWTWFAEVDETHTHLYANFHGRDPTQELVEINVRDACFYPAQPGCDFITVRGFRMAHAATQWAAPTAEQIGLLGTHWSRGWIIEHNVISDSKCSGITLGKDRATGHNVWNANRAKDGATHYNEVIDRALAAGWSRAKIGGHVVRHNEIFACEQTGICGSLGAVFSTITDNHIHHIWEKRQFAGAEMGGIKLHGAIDVLIARNHLHATGRGLWLDWMAQGTRVTGNLFHDNTTDDLFVEVNHGPFMVDHNLFLSPTALRDWSQGGAYAHNLFGGVIDAAQELRRVTPYHAAHDTAVAGRTSIRGGDNRWFNNLFAGGPPPAAKPGAAEVKSRGRTIGHGLAGYDGREQASPAAGNVYLHHALPLATEAGTVVRPDFDPQVRLTERDGARWLSLHLPSATAEARTSRVTTAVLGKTAAAGLPYRDHDGAPLSLDTDFHGRPRATDRPTPGPFEAPTGELSVRVSP